MKVILYMAMTVNGMIAKEDDETPWSDATWQSYYNIAKHFKAMILGRRTYEIMSKVNEFEKLGNPFTVVVSSSKAKRKSTQNTAFVSTPAEAVSLLREKKFGEAMLAGGGTVNGSFAKENLIDEIILDVEPLIFGRGIKLFGDAGFELRLQLLEVKKISENLLQLHYRVLR
ncbi:dihydrofolate reductase [archaeon]|nr:dihydrofolate reductase [archaeon]